MELIENIKPLKKEIEDTSICANFCMIITCALLILFLIMMISNPSSMDKEPYKSMFPDIKKLGEEYYYCMPKSSCDRDDCMYSICETNNGICKQAIGLSGLTDLKDNCILDCQCPDGFICGDGDSNENNSISNKICVKKPQIERTEIQVYYKGMIYDMK